MDFPHLEVRVRAADDQTLILALGDPPYTEVAILRAAEHRDYSDADKQAVLWGRLFASAASLYTFCDQLDTAIKADVQRGIVHTLTHPEKTMLDLVLLPMRRALRKERATAGLSSIVDLADRLQDIQRRHRGFHEEITRMNDDIANGGHLNTDVQKERIIRAGIRLTELTKIISMLGLELPGLVENDAHYLLDDVELVALEWASVAGGASMLLHDVATETPRYKVLADGELEACEVVEGVYESKGASGKTVDDLKPVVRP
jgi:hypothetical protein